MISNEKKSVWFHNQLSTITNIPKIEKIPIVKVKDIGQDIQNFESDFIKEKYSVMHSNNLHNRRNSAKKDNTSKKEDNCTVNKESEGQDFGNKNDNYCEMIHKKGKGKDSNHGNSDLDKNKAMKLKTSNQEAVNVSDEENVTITNNLRQLPDNDLIDNEDCNTHFKSKSVMETYSKSSEELSKIRETDEDTLSNVEVIDDTLGFVKLVDLGSCSTSSSSSDEDDRDEDFRAKGNSSEFLGFISNIPITLSAKARRKLKRKSTVCFCDNECSECDLHSTTSFERPKKRTKISEKPIDKKELYNLILDWKKDKQDQAREDYNNQLLEKFFLENNGQMMDYQKWLRKPSWDLLLHMKNNKLTGDETLLKKFEGCKFYHYYDTIIKEKSLVYDSVSENVPQKAIKSKSSSTNLVEKNYSSSTNIMEKNIKERSKQTNILSLIGRLAAPLNRSKDDQPKEDSVPKDKENSVTKDTVQESDCEIISVSAYMHKPRPSSSPQKKQNKKLHSDKSISDNDVQNTDYGKLVWAKLRGFRPYPAMIVNPYECGMEQHTDRVCVFWMADTRVSQIPLVDVKDFVSNVSKEALDDRRDLDYRKSIICMLKECCRRANVRLEESGTGRKKLLKVGDIEPPAPIYQALVKWGSIAFFRDLKIYAPQTDGCPYPPEIEEWLKEIDELREEEKCGRSHTEKDKCQNSYTTEKEIQVDVQTTKEQEVENEESEIISSTGRVIKSKKYSDYAYNEQDIVAAAVKSKNKKLKDIRSHKDNEDSDSDPGTYEVEKILNHRMGHRGMDFLVQWVDFDEENSTWEPKTNLLGCLGLVNEYLENFHKKRQQEQKQLLQQTSQQQYGREEEELDVEGLEEGLSVAASDSSEQQNDTEDDEGFDNLQQLLEPEMILKEEGVRVVAGNRIYQSSDDDVQFVDVSNSILPPQQTLFKVPNRSQKKQNGSNCELPTTEFVRTASSNNSQNVPGHSNDAATPYSCVKVNLRGKKTMLLMKDPKMLKQYLSNSSNHSKNIITVRKPSENILSNFRQIVPVGLNLSKNLITVRKPSKNILSNYRQIAPAGSQTPRTIIPIENIQNLIGNNRMLRVSSTLNESNGNLSTNTTTSTATTTTNKNLIKAINDLRHEITSQVNLSSESEVIDNNMESGYAEESGFEQSLSDGSEMADDTSELQVVDRCSPNSAATRITNKANINRGDICLRKEDNKRKNCDSETSSTSFSDAAAVVPSTPAANETGTQVRIDCMQEENDRRLALDIPGYNWLEQKIKQGTIGNLRKAQLELSKTSNNVISIGEYSDKNAEEIRKHSSSPRIGVRTHLQTAVSIVPPSRVTALPKTTQQKMFTAKAFYDAKFQKTLEKNMNTLLNFTFNFDHFPSDRNMGVLAAFIKMKEHDLQNWFMKMRQPLQIMLDAPLMYCKFCSLKLQSRPQGINHLYSHKHFIKVLGRSCLNGLPSRSQVTINSMSGKLVMHMEGDKEKNPPTKVSSVSNINSKDDDDDLDDNNEASNGPSDNDTDTADDDSDSESLHIEEDFQKESHCEPKMIDIANKRSGESILGEFVNLENIKEEAAEDLCLINEEPSDTYENNSMYEDFLQDPLVNEEDIPNGDLQNETTPINVFTGLLASSDVMHELRKYFDHQNLHIRSQNNPYYSTEYLIYQAIMKSKQGKLREKNILMWIRYCYPHYKKVKNLTTKVMEELIKNSCFTEEIHNENKYWLICLSESVSRFPENPAQYFDKNTSVEANTQSSTSISELNKPSEIYALNTRIISCNGETSDSYVSSLNTEKLHTVTSVGLASHINMAASQEVLSKSIRDLDVTSKLLSVTNAGIKTNLQSSLLCQNLNTNVSETYSTLLKPRMSIFESKTTFKAASSAMITSEETSKETLPGTTTVINQRIDYPLNASSKIPKSNAKSSLEGISEVTSKLMPFEPKASLSTKKNTSSKNLKILSESDPISKDCETTNVFQANDSEDPETTHKYFIKTKLHDDGKTYQYLYREDGKDNKLIGFKELTEAETSLIKIEDEIDVVSVNSLDSTSSTTTSSTSTSRSRKSYNSSISIADSVHDTKVLKDRAAWVGGEGPTNPSRRASKEIRQAMSQGVKRRGKYKRRSKVIKLKAPKMLQGSNGRRSGSHRSHSEVPERQQKRNSLEKMRTVDIRNAFEEVRSLVPELQDCEKAPKIEILMKAIDFCKFVTKQDQHMAQERERLRRYQHELKRKKAALE